MKTLKNIVLMIGFLCFCNFAFSQGLEKVDGKWNLLDKKGKILNTFVCDSLHEVSYFWKNKYVLALQNGKWQLWNKKSLPVINESFDSIIGVDNGLEWDGKYCIVRKNGLDGAIDQNGKLVTACKYHFPFTTDDLYNVSNVILISQNNKYGLLDKNMKEIIPCRFDSIFRTEQFAEYSNYLVTQQGDKFGLYSITGSELQPCKYDAISNLACWNCGKYIFIKQFGKTGLLNPLGIEIIPCIYDSIIALDDCLFYGTKVAHIQRAGKMGVVNFEGKLLTEIKYDSIEYPIEGYTPVIINSKYGLLDKDFKELYPCKYDEITPQKNGSAYAQSGEKSYLLYPDGRVIENK